jgi:hypothetical protein
MWPLRIILGDFARFSRLFDHEKWKSLLATRVKRPKTWVKRTWVASQLGNQGQRFDLKGGKSGA